MTHAVEAAPGLQLHPDPVDPVEHAGPAGPVEPAVAEDWVALHIFYSSNSNPLLADLVTPLVAELRAEGLIDRWFFLRYWMEGPHIRFRLLPSSPDARDTVRIRAEEAITAYLKQRPALYRMDPDLLGGMYKEMFLLEYTEQEWEERYGPEGMPLRETNAVAQFPYEPEYVKYGGPAGVRIAERHFEASSDLVVSLVAGTNIHVRTVMFGLAIQLMTVMTTVFTDSRQDRIAFLEGYQKVWEGTFIQADSATRDGFDRNYADMGERLLRRVRDIESAVEARDHGRLTGFLRDWADHCVTLRDEIREAVERRELWFPTTYGAAERLPVTDPQVAFRYLLVPYVHMTNNRLGVSIVEEVYLSHLLARALDELGQDAA